MKHRMPRGAFGVIIKAALEYVLHILGVARDCHETLLSSQERNGADAGLVRAATRSEVVADPVMQSVTVLDQARKTAQQGPDTWTL